MTVRVRFAPSPTGLLHVGNARAALINWLYARHAGGAFVLRIDDTDPERSRPEYAAAIERDLAWLGLDWDQRLRQSTRLDRYGDAFERLRAAGRVYDCYETEAELAEKRRALAARGRPPVYDRAALALDDADRARLRAEGRKPHWRFRLDDTSARWDDLVRGPVAIRARTMSDPVIRRGDGLPTYTLASVVDDVDLAIGSVIRGEDHVANTAVQIQLFAALDAPPPVFAHLPLLVDAEGKNLSKRRGALSLATLREAGIEPLALASLLARLGSADPVEPRTSMNALIADFDIARFGRAAPRFDRDELARLNARVLRDLPFEAVAERLARLGIEGASREFWEAVRDNLDRLDDALEWWRVVAGPISPLIEDPALIEHAAALLPDAPWDATIWTIWTKSVAEATEKRGRALYHPLRLALTGLERGPALANLLPLIGHDRVLARLRGQPA